MIDLAHAWAGTAFGEPSKVDPPDRQVPVPFSFLYDGAPSDALLGGWDYSARTEPAARP